MHDAGSGTIEVDRYSLETSRERFYAGGDLITGASNVSNAMGYGKKAARSIDRKLMGRKRFTSLFPEFDYEMEPPETQVECGRHVPAEMPAAQRVLVVRRGLARPHARGGHGRRHPAACAATSAASSD